MTLLTFAIALIVILAVLYALNYVWPMPRPIQVIINVVAGLVVFFMVLALFRVMPLPFTLK